MADEVAYNPFDPSFHADPYPHYRDLLAGPPRRLAPRVPGVLVARYADGGAVTRDHATVSSALPPFMFARGPDPFGGAMTMPFSDPPVHSRLRRMVARDFSPRRIALLAPRIGEIIRQLLETSGEGGRFEAMSALANQLPVVIIAEMLGVPSEHRERFRRWSDAVASNDPPVHSRLRRMVARDWHGQESRRIRGPRGVGVARIPGAGNRAAAGRSRG